MGATNTTMQCGCIVPDEVVVKVYASIKPLLCKCGQKWTPDQVREAARQALKIPKPILAAAKKAKKFKMPKSPSPPKPGPTASLEDVRHYVQAILDEGGRCPGRPLPHQACEEATAGRRG